MAVPSCIEIEIPPPPPKFQLPALGIIEVARNSLYTLPDPSEALMTAMQQLSVALAPVRWLLEIVDTLAVFKRCAEAIPKAIISFNPAGIFECIEDLVVAFGRILSYIPPFSYFVTMVDVAAYSIDLIDAIVNLLADLDARITEYKELLDLSTQFDDADLLVTAECMQTEVKALASAAMDVLKLLQPIQIILWDVIKQYPPVSAFEQQIDEFKDLFTNLDDIQNDIAQGASIPQLGAMVSILGLLRNSLVGLYNIVAPIIGRDTRAIVAIQSFNNF